MILAGDVLADRLGVSGIEPRARRRRCGYVKWASRRPSTECSKASVERSVCAATAEVGHLYRTVELAILASDAKCFEKGIQDSFQPPPPAGADASAAHVDRVAMNQPPGAGPGVPAKTLLRARERHSYSRLPYDDCLPAQHLAATGQRPPKLSPALAHW